MKRHILKPQIGILAAQPLTASQTEQCAKSRRFTKLRAALLVVAVIAMAMSAWAQTGTVYMVTQDNICSTNPACDTNTLVSFDLSNLSSGIYNITKIGLTTIQGGGGVTAEIRGLAFDNYTSTLYGITAQGVLVTVDETTGLSTPVFTLPYWPPGSIQNEWSGIASDGQNNLYVVNAFGNNELVDIDITKPNAPTSTLIGSTVYTYSGQKIPQQILGLAYSASGVLYGTDRTIDNVVIINAQTASVSIPYPHTAGTNNLQEIGFDPSGNLYAVYDHVATSNDAGFASYNFTTGNATALGQLPFEIDFDGHWGNSTYGAGGWAFLSACIAPPSNMIAWYPLDPSSTANNPPEPDLVNNNTAASTGFPASIVGEVSGALSFNGTSNYLQAPDQPWLDIGGKQDLSFDAWVKLSATTPGVVSMVDKRQGAPQRGYQFFLYNGRPGVQLADGLGTMGYDNYVATAPVPTDSKWHLVAMTVQRSSSSCGTSCGTFYLDGSSAGTFDPSIHSGALSSPGIPLMIGAQDASVGLSEFFAGGLDEVELFNRVLNPTEVMALYKAGTAGKCK